MADLFKLFGRIAIDNQEANKSIDDTTEKAKGLGDSIKGAGEEADKTSDKMGEKSQFGTAAVWMGNMLYNLTTKAADLTLKLGKIGFGFNASIESYTAQFKAMIGDEEKAVELLENIKDLAKDTPLGMEGLVINATSLMGAGVSVDDMIERLTMLGNIARGSQTAMDSVTKAYRDVMGKQKLMAQELYQFTEAGVNIVKLLTEYGGEDYADGSWYSAMVQDPKKHAVPFEDLHNAFKRATEEGGNFYGYMDTMMTTYAGQLDRFQEGGKETLGLFTQPFFTNAAENVLPRMSEALDKFGTWVTNNQGTLEKMADAVGGMVSGGFDKLLEVLQWMIDNGEKAKTVFMGIATAMYLGAISAHPYATAIMTIVAGLYALSSAPDDPLANVFDGYSGEDLELLQRWIDAANEAKALEDTMLESQASQDAYTAARDRADALEAEVNAVKGLRQAYSTWSSAQPGYKGESDFYLDIPPRLAEGSEESLQNGLDAMALEAEAKIYGDYSALYSGVSSLGLTAYANVVPSYSYGAAKVDGSHADGLDYVPHDNYIANLHRGEAVLTASQASAWRSGNMGGGDVSRLESAINNLGGMLNQIIANTAAGHQVVLDSGVVCGQLAPQMDAQLGTILNRKGRRN